MLPTMADANQSRETSMPLQKNQFDTMATDIDPYTKMGSNPAVSAKQQRFMGMCAHSPGKAKGKCPSHEVSEEFSHKD